MCGRIKTMEGSYRQRNRMNLRTVSLDIPSMLCNVSVKRTESYFWTFHSVKERRYKGCWDPE